MRALLPRDAEKWFLSAPTLPIPAGFPRKLQNSLKTRRWISKNWHGQLRHSTFPASKFCAPEFPDSSTQYCGRDAAIGTFLEVARMAIRVTSRLGRLIGLCVASAMVGCVAQQQQKPTAAADLPAFRDPSQIKPAESALKPTPVAPPVAESPAFTKAPAAPYAAWVPATRSRPWKYIVIHHSATPDGNASKFDREHKAKGWDELGYHFVIDNGRGGPDGKVEVGPRWPKQKWGAHAKTPDNRFNEQGIGICLVGNFESGRPTPKQMQATAKLVAYLMQTYSIPAKNVIGHDDTKSTLCPGRFLNLATVRAQASNAVAGLDVGDLPEEEQSAAAHVAAAPTDRELLRAQ
jgi:hypothetical protein